MKKVKRLPLTAVSLTLLLSLIIPFFTGFPITFGAAAGVTVDGTLGEVRLITGDVLEIEFSEPVLNKADAQATFKILVDGMEVEWEYLSYFAFGSYMSSPVVNVRLKDSLDAGEPRGRRRTSTAEAYLERTENVKGPIAAARITVKAGTAEKTPLWHAFYLERSQGNMSRYYTYASRKAGNNGSVLELTNSLSDFQDARNVFSTTQKLYTDEYAVRMVAEGMNKITGRSEYLNLPLIYAGFKALIVGPSQSVYEVPEYRELYSHGVTTDTFTRTSIKATEVPGNYNPATGKYKKPFIVGTSDDVLKHYSPMKADGTPSTGNADAARPESDLFYFGEAFFDIFYELGVLQGSQDYPLTAFNKPDDRRYDLHLQEAYDKALAAGMWPGTKMMESVKDYYIGGALTHFEMIPETQQFMEKSWPINTRYELVDYDYPLYWALSGLHSQVQFWCGVNPGQSVDANADAWKLHTAWFWQNQIDNYGLPAANDPTKGAEYPPLAIKSVEVVDHNRIYVTFNREVSTLSAVTRPDNWKIYIDDREISPTVHGGYAWRGIFLRTNHAVNYQTGLSTANAINRLDNGKPYGPYFAGFTQKDIDERKIDAGGWLANDQEPGRYPLEYGDFVSVQDAIDNYGAGLAGKIEVAYVGGASGTSGAYSNNKVLDWAGNELEKKKIEADFMPWNGHVYRTPLTGMYIYLDSKVGTEPYYMYRNEPAGFKQPGAKEVAMAAGHQFESLFTVNTKVTYPKNAGGDDFDYAFDNNSNSDWNLTNPSWGLDYTWNNGVVTRTNTAGSDPSVRVIKQGPVTYDRPGQMTIDGFVVRSGAMFLGAGNVRGGHSQRMNHRSAFASGIGDSLRIEGNGNANEIYFESNDVGVLRDYNLALYNNESLVFHEGGHGIDEAQATYAYHLHDDMTSAFATATAPKNGMRWFTVDGVRSYTASRAEYVSMGANYWSGTGRESFEGINDGVWTPIGNREEYHRYDPYAFEAHKRVMFNGDLGLWYEGKIGDPDYRVIPEDWELLRDQNPQFSHWTGENDLVAWGATISAIARDNPYTGQTNPLVRWVSFGNPALWDPAHYTEPTRDGWRSNIRFDFAGRVPYHPTEEGTVPTQNQTHPFFAGAGVKKPVRTAEIEALVAPIGGKIVEGSLKMISKILFEFELEDFTGDVTMNNATQSFDLRVDGKKQHFYFWTFEDIGNNIAKVQLRLEWPENNDPTLKLTVKKTGQTAISDAVLRLNLSKGVVEKDETFTLSPAFSRAIESNVAVLDYTYNKELFEYKGFTPADGVKPVSEEQTPTGVRVTVMVQDYSMKDYGVFLFGARTDVDLKLETQKIVLTVNFVERAGDKKWTKMAVVDTVFATSNGTDPTNPILNSEFTLVTLSNAIDYFGVSRRMPGWDVALFFDYNANGEIDITDITHVASKIVLQ